MAKNPQPNVAKANAKVIENPPHKLTDAIRNPALMVLLGDVHGKRLLDLGCSNGESSRKLQALGAIVTGADYSADQIELAKSHEDGIDYILTEEGSKLALKSANFDVVTYFSMRATEHLDEMLAESSRVLKKSGKILLSVLHPSFIGAGRKLIKAQDGSVGIFVNHYFTEEMRLNPQHQSGANQAKVSNLIRNHTVSDYINKVIQSGFVIQHVQEPRATDLAQLNDAEINFWSTHAARYLIIMASKVK